MVAGVGLLMGKVVLAGAAGLASLAPVGVLANVALVGGGIMFLREARRHTVRSAELESSSGAVE